MILSKENLVFALDVINQCLNARKQDDMKHIFAQLEEHLDISGAIVGQTQSLEQSHLSEARVEGYGCAKAWVEIYDNEGFASIDPVIPFAFQNTHPIRWVDAYRDASKQQGEFISQAQDFGLQDGISNAVMADRKNGHVTVVSTIFATPPSIEQITLLQNIMPHINEAVANPQLWDRPHLTEKELEVLRWVKDGKSYWETGQIMSISERTVKFHLSNIYKKLKVVNRSQAIYRALCLGYINL